MSIRAKLAKSRTREDFFLDEDDIHRFWDEEYRGTLDWCDIAETARELWGEMFTGDGPIKEDTVLAAFLSGIAAAAQASAFEAVGRAVGCSGRDIRSACDNFCEESPDARAAKPLLPIGWDGLRAEVEAFQREYGLRYGDGY